MSWPAVPNHAAGGIADGRLGPEGEGGVLARMSEQTRVFGIRGREVAESRENCQDLRGKLFAFCYQLGRKSYL